MIVTKRYPESGISPDLSQRRPARCGARAMANPLERLIQILKENERLLQRLKQQSERLNRARANAVDPASKRQFAEILLDHEKEKYASLVHQIRVNRGEALTILRTTGQIGGNGSRIL